MKRTILLLAALFTRFMLPALIVTDFDLSKIFKNPTLALSTLGIVLGLTTFYFLNKTFDNILKDKPNHHIGLFLFKITKQIITTAILAVIFVAVGEFSTQLWKFVVLFGALYAFSEYILYEYFLEVQKKEKE